MQLEKALWLSESCRYYFLSVMDLHPAEDHFTIV